MREPEEDSGECDRDRAHEDGEDRSLADAAQHGDTVSLRPVAASIAAAGCRGRRSRRRTGDHGDTPDADVLEAVALNVAPSLVLDERVERAAAEGDLAPAVGPLDDAEVRNAGCDGALCECQRLPQSQACAGAGELALALDAEAVERHA